MGEKLNGLTPDEFRNILSENLRKKGFINNLKSQIRGRLIKDLSDKQTTLKPLRSSSLLHNAVNSLILHHFKTFHYDYSFSVFMPECGLDRVLKMEEITSIVRSGKEDGSAESVLEEVLLSNKPLSLSDKFDALDELCYNKKLLADFVSLGRLHKDRHLSNNKGGYFDRENLKYREMMRHELEEQRRKLRQTHDEEMKVLMEREKEVRMQQQQQQEMLDKEAFMQRQKVLQAMQEVKMARDAIKNKETLIDQQLHSLEEAKRRFEDEVKREKNDLEEEKTKVMANLEAKAHRLQAEFESESGIFKETMACKERELQKKEEDLKKECERLEDMCEKMRQKEQELSDLKVQLAHSSAEVKLLGRLKREKEEECSRKQQDLQQLQVKLNTTEAVLKKTQKDNEAEQQRLREEIDDLKEALKLSPSHHQQLQRLRNQVQHLHSSLLLQQQLNQQQLVNFSNKAKAQEWKIRQLLEELRMLQKREEAGMESGEEDLVREARFKLISLQTESMKLDANMDRLLSGRAASTLQSFKAHPPPRPSTNKLNQHIDYPLKTTPIIPSDFGHPLLNGFNATLGASFGDSLLLNHGAFERQLVGEMSLGVNIKNIGDDLLNRVDLYDINNMGDAYGGVQMERMTREMVHTDETRFKTGDSSLKIEGNNLNNVRAQNEQKYMSDNVEVNENRATPSKRQDALNVGEHEIEGGKSELANAHSTPFNTTNNNTHDVKTETLSHQHDMVDEDKHKDTSAKEGANEMDRYMNMMKPTKPSVTTSSYSSSSDEVNASDDKIKSKDGSGDDGSW